MRRRKALNNFSLQMEQVLRKNDHKGGWSECSRSYLFNSLIAEVFELFKVLKPDEHHTIFGDSDIDPDKIVEECCDIANFAMMIADNHALHTTAEQRGL